MIAINLCLVFLALLCALVGSFVLMIARAHLRDPDFLPSQWAKHEQATFARGITPTRTPAWDQKILRQEKTRQLVAWGLLSLSPIIILIILIRGRG